MTNINKEKLTHLYIVRHGQTDWNAQLKIQGRTETSLNDQGKEQIRLLAQNLLDIPFAAIYTSTLQRAKETAQIISSVHGTSVFHEPTLEEASFGVIEGMTIEEYHRLYEKEVAYHRSLKRHERIKNRVVPGAETSQEVLDRTLPTLQRISQNHTDQNVLIVTHGHVIKVLISALEEVHEHSVSITNGGYIYFQSDGKQFKRVDQKDFSLN